MVSLSNHQKSFDRLRTSGGDLDDAIWRMDNVELTTVGIDVGSSTSHLMFARVHLQRLGHALSSRFVVVNREILWRSPILLTPYRPDDTIDAEQLGRFIHQAYRDAGLERADVASGAVILTGEALKRTNARGIADLFAAEAGKFVCASAGHHLEAVMAAHGSGAVGLSRADHRTLLSVDIGGGTTKLSLIRDGEVLHTAAVAVGGRLVASDANGALVRIEGPALQAADAAGVPLALGQRLTEGEEAQFVRTLANVLVQIIQEAICTPSSPATEREGNGAGPLTTHDSQLATQLMITARLPGNLQPEAIAFSGGVAEYIYEREAGDYNDLGRALAREMRAATTDGRIPLPVLEPSQGIRATVIGASQFTVQVSGNTIFVSDPTVLPLTNLPVLRPAIDFADEFTAAEVAAAVRGSMERLGAGDGDHPLALAFLWQGRPLYGRLRSLAEGIQQAMPRSIQRRLPVVLLVDGDVGRTVGMILKRELPVPGDVVSLDGMELREFDYVDIGEIIQPANVAPVVIKSLLFDGTPSPSPLPQGGEVGHRA